MALGWHDVLSVASDIIGLLGIPVLVVTTFGLFREIKKERAERKALKTVSEGCLEFLDSEHKIGINLVPVERVPLMPGRVISFIFRVKALNMGLGSTKLKESDSLFPKL